MNEYVMQQTRHNSFGDMNLVCCAVPAKFTTAEQNYTARLGEPVAMDCLSEGDKPLSVAWSFNHGNIDWQYNTRSVSISVTLNNAAGCPKSKQPAAEVSLNLIK